VFGTSVLWFERGWSEEALRPEHWRELCLASVTTHDLPPTAGFLAGAHVELRGSLGLLERSVDEERAVHEAEVAEWVALLVELGLLRANASEREIIEALHRFLVRTPSRLLGVALPDAVGDRRPVNQPGTHREYPNWQVPMTDATGAAVLLEDLPAHPRLRSLVDAVRG
jgi:4-alpha-glucanotransferase